MGSEIAPNDLEFCVLWGSTNPVIYLTSISIFPSQKLWLCHSMTDDLWSMSSLVQWVSDNTGNDLRTGRRVKIKIF